MLCLLPGILCFLLSRFIQLHVFPIFSLCKVTCTGIFTCYFMNCNSSWWFYMWWLSESWVSGTHWSCLKRNLGVFLWCGRKFCQTLHDGDLYRAVYVHSSFVGLGCQGQRRIFRIKTQFFFSSFFFLFFNSLNAVLLFSVFWHCWCLKYMILFYILFDSK